MALAVAAALVAALAVALLPRGTGHRATTADRSPTPSAPRTRPPAVDGTDPYSDGCKPTGALSTPCR
ncbi:hypothetical protein ACFOOM_09840 [Streptomyces echinoruber]|uniref:hypothetical protein n=1 Tax=Streptomyces echinoruber TaxID=68898 RepID=UPI001E6455CB|nr:hypothetical protein [Streptomyces echinoruber]